MHTIPVLEFFGETEVADLEVSLSIQKEVLGLEVSVDDCQWVEIVEDERDFGSVEHGRGSVEPTGVAQVREQLSAANVLEYHVQISVVVFRAQPTMHTSAINDLSQCTVQYLTAHANLLIYTPTVTVTYVTQLAAWSSGNVL